MNNRTSSVITRRQTAALALVAGADFALRIAIVRPGSFQFSDGIRLIDWPTAVASKVQPLVPALVVGLRQFGIDPILAAGLVASTLGALAVFPLFLLAARLYGEEAGWWAVALYSANFFVYMQSAGVTANPALVFCLLAAALALLDLAESEGRYGATALVAWAGLAALARPEGLLLWPLALLGAMWQVKQHGTAAVPALGVAAVPMAAWAYWNFRVAHGFEYGGEIAVGAGLATPAKFAKYLLAYLKDFSAGLLHVYTVAALAGVVISVRRFGTETAARAWNYFLAYCAAAFLVVLALHWAFVPRLLAPLVVLALVPAGLALHALSLRHVALRIACVVLVALTAVGGTAVIVGLHGALRGIGGDIRAAAEALPSVTTQTDRIVADLPTETAYFSGRAVSFYIPSLANAGDVVVLNNVTTDLDAETRALSRRFAVRTLLERTAPYVSPKKGGLPIKKGGVGMMDLSERERPLAEEPYRTVVLRLGRNNPHPGLRPPLSRLAGEGPGVRAFCFPPADLIDSPTACAEPLKRLDINKLSPAQHGVPKEIAPWRVP